MRIPTAAIVCNNNLNNNILIKYWMTAERSFNGGCKCEINIKVIYRIYVWFNTVTEEEQCPLSEQAKFIYCIELSAKLGKLTALG